MKSALAIGIVTLAIALPLAAAAQSISPGTSDLTIEKRDKRAIVLPKPNSEQIRVDADRAVNDYAATQDRHRLVKDTSPLRPAARPDFDYDVRTGIQSQRLNDALRDRK